jgi:hypothetical protein
MSLRPRLARCVNPAGVDRPDGNVPAATHTATSRLPGVVGRLNVAVHVLDWYFATVLAADCSRTGGTGQTPAKNI